MTCNVSYYDRKGWIAIQKSKNSIAFYDIYKEIYINEIYVKEKIVFFFFHYDFEKFTIVCSAGEFYDYDIYSWEILKIKVLKGKSFSEGYNFSKISDKIFLKSFSNEIDIIKKSNYQLINNRGFSFPILDLQLSSDGTIFYVGIPQNYILPCRVDLSTSGKPITLPNKLGKFFISDDNSNLYSLLDGIFSIFSLKNLKKIGEFDIKNISSYVILPDNKTAILGDHYGNIIFYDIILNKTLSSEKVHSSAIKNLLLISERNILFSISNYGEINLKPLDVDYIFLSDPIAPSLSTIEISNQISSFKPIILTEVLKFIDLEKNIAPVFLFPEFNPKFFNSTSLSLETINRTLIRIPIIYKSENIDKGLDISSTTPYHLRINDTVQPVIKLKEIETHNAIFESNINSSIIPSTKNLYKIHSIQFFPNLFSCKDGIKLFGVIDSTTSVIGLLSANFPISFLNNFESSLSEIPINSVNSDIIYYTILWNTENLISPEIPENPISINCVNLISNLHQINELSSNIKETDCQQLVVPTPRNWLFDQNSINIHIYPSLSQISEKGSINSSKPIHYDILPFLVFPEVKRENIPNSQLEFDLLGDAAISIRFYDLLNNSPIQPINSDCKIIVDGKELNTRSDNSGFQIPIFEKMKITIKNSNDQKITTEFSGISESHPFLLFIDEGKRKIDYPKDIKEDFIFITSKNNRLIPENSFNNCGSVKNWENYLFYEIPYDKSIIYAIRTNEGKIFPIANDIGIISELQGGAVCENLPIINEEKIYCQAPNLIIQCLPHKINDLNIEIKLKDHVIFPDVVNKLSSIDDFQYELLLPELLDPQKAGNYTIIIQNKFKDFQIKHPFILVPELKIEIENKDILFYTWDKDHVNISFIIEGPNRINHGQEIGSKCFRFKSNIIFLNGVTDYRTVLTLYYSIYSVEIVLLIPVIFSKVVISNETLIRGQFVEINDYEKIISLLPSGKISLKRELPKEIFDLDEHNLSIQVFIPWYLKFCHYNLYVSCSDDALIHFQDFNHFKQKKYNNNYVIRQYDLNIFKDTIEANYTLLPLTLNYEGYSNNRKSISHLFSIAPWKIDDLQISVENNKITAQWKKWCLLKHETHVTISHNNSQGEVFCKNTQKSLQDRISLPFTDLSELNSVTLKFDTQISDDKITSLMFENIDASSNILLAISYLKINQPKNAIKILANGPDAIKYYYEGHIYGLFYKDYLKAEKIFNDNFDLQNNFDNKKWIFSISYYLFKSQNQIDDNNIRNILCQNPGDRIALLLYAVNLTTSDTLQIVMILNMLISIKRNYKSPIYYIIEAWCLLNISEHGFEINEMEIVEIIKEGVNKYPYIPEFWILIYQLLPIINKTNLQPLSLVISNILSKGKTITSKDLTALWTYIDQII